ncbi:sensor histidine kinase [Salinactinospora qingdaonensis]|uniref:histidine kinase n=1 Tax=Salinactinospora qingdaonensis TaxID=702744 RepID=A0ABP7FH02_9ACTN
MIVLVPTSALIVLWLLISGYLTFVTVQQYLTAKAGEEGLAPASRALIAAMDERSATIAYLERPQENRERLNQAREVNDNITEDLQSDLESLRTISPPAVEEALDTFTGYAYSTSELRTRVDTGQATRAEVLESYNSLMRAGAQLFDSQARATSPSEVVGSGLSATYTFRAVDNLSQADAYLARGFASGEMTVTEQQQFARLIGAYHSHLDAVAPHMAPEERDQLAELRNSNEYSLLVGLENQIAKRRTTASADPNTLELSYDMSTPVSEQEWREVYSPVKQQLRDIATEQALHTVEQQADIARNTMLMAIGGSLGVACIAVLAVLIALRAAQRLTSRLNLLRDQTQELADNQLPTIVERLKRNEYVDVSAAVPDSSHSNDEIGQVAQSFSAAQRTAVEAAVQQAELRDGVNKVFLNIAHRSQTLVHRQLRLLDQMERAQEDPEHLTELFKLDHLATRSRRNAENLLILGGESPGRTWHRPMPLIDVLRGAISESGDYTRIKRQQITRVSLTGSAVADVIHIVAELLDNATTFSPPHTQVQLHSERLPNGVSIDIEDRGLGMKDDELAAANDLLANPPEFDVMRLNEKMRLGLFVVSRLAQRHGIKVILRPSPYGGIQAIVMLPSSLIVTDAPDPTPGTADDTDDRADQIPPRVFAPHKPDAPAAATSEETGETEDVRHDTDPATESGDAPPQAPTPENGAPTAAGQEPGSGKADLPRRSRHSSHSGGASPHPATPTPHLADATAGSNGAATQRPSLPKRTPQANLAPELSGGSVVSLPPAGSATPSGRSSGDSADRSRQLRRKLSAFQDGTRRGRQDGRQLHNESEKEQHRDE